jgi:hypothetical protein
MPMPPFLDEEIVTQDMEEEGARVLEDELGDDDQHLLRYVARRVFLAMLDVAPEEEWPH